MEKTTENAWRISFPEWEQLPDIGLYMDQVITLMERTFMKALPKGDMTKSMVNNYVKVGLIPRPAKKKYDREHLAMLLMICVLKQALSMEHIACLLEDLCAAGVREGYTQFLLLVCDVETAAREGRVEFAAEESMSEQALRSGIMAAMCTIRTCRLLRALREERDAKGGA